MGKENSNAKTSVIEPILVVVFFSILVLGITVGLGAILSGWHLVDDHQLFGYITRFRYRGDTVLDVIKSELKRDFTAQHRARFLYYPTRVLQTWLFGFNPLPYYIVKSVETIIAMTFLYFVGRELKLNYYLSALFSIIVLAGNQSTVWYKLGPQHLQGTMFLAIGLYYLLVYLRKRNKPSLIVSMIGFLLMVCFHESFLMVIPFVILFVIFREIKSDDENEKVTFPKIFEAIKKDLVVLIPLAIIFVAVFLYIVLFLGLFSYGIIEESTSMGDRIDNLKSGVINGDFGPYWYAGIAIMVIFATYYESIKPVWYELILLVAAVSPQFMLYTSEPMYERYLLPLTFCWTMFFIAAYGRNFISGGRKILQAVLLTGLALMLLRTTVIEADYYRFRGESVTAMLDEVLAVTENGYTVTCTLGICNPEADTTVRNWLTSHGYENCWYWNENVKKIKDATQSLGDDTPGDHAVDDVDLFVVYNADDRHYTMMPSIDLSGFNYVKCGSVSLYFSDRAYNTLTDADFAGFKIKPTIYGIGDGE